jgi:putative Ca2+/H+ antiporter (TMEM165/GDT1 family)
VDWLTSFLLIFAAEFGDKSQLVCMALAVRYRAAPVALGAVAAFLLLNTLAVVFGVAIANWIPELVISIIVSLLFLFFGIQSLREASAEEEQLDDSDVAIKSQNHIFFSTLALITLAEFGDKTQLAVVALSARFEPLSVWIGASLALAATSLMAVWAGRTILQRISMTLLHRLSGLLFIVLAAFAAYSAYLAYYSL